MELHTASSSCPFLIICFIQLADTLELEHARSVVFDTCCIVVCWTREANWTPRRWKTQAVWRLRAVLWARQACWHRSLAACMELVLGCIVIHSRLVLYACFFLLHPYTVLCAPICAIWKAFEG